MYTALSGITGACVGILHPQTRSIVLLRVNIITRGWVMIDLKAQLYWARVKRWVASGTSIYGFNFTKYTARQRKLFVLRRTIPDAKLKKTSVEERGEAILGNTSRFTGHLAHYTQSEHLIGLRRMGGLNSMGKFRGDTKQN